MIPSYRTINRITQLIVYALNNSVGNILGGTDGNGDGNGDEHNNFHIIIVIPIPNVHEYKTYVGRDSIGCIVNQMQ